MKFIVIDGNIGSGKTTLINNLEKHYSNLFFIREDVEEWKKCGILDKYYENPKEMAFTFQMKVAISHLKNINKLIKTHGENITIISERSTYSCYYIFTKMLEKIKYMNDFEVNIHQDLCINCCIKPDIYIYLSTNVDEVMNRILKRNRETNISKKYLEELNEQYNELKTICLNNGIIFFTINANSTIDNVRDKAIEEIDKLIYKKN